MPGSNKQGGLGRPFGYLKPASTGGTVNLIILAYDYPQLNALLSQFMKVCICPTNRSPTTSSGTLGTVYLPLFVSAPVCLCLLNGLCHDLRHVYPCLTRKVQKLQPSKPFLAQFEQYIASVPPYYIPVRCSQILLLSPFTMCSNNVFLCSISVTCGQICSQQ